MIVRAAAAHLLAHRANRNPEVLAQKQWSRRPEVAEVIRAASSPATLTSASVLAQTAISDFFVSLGASSAAATVIQGGVKVAFDSYASVVVPGVVSAAGNAGFVGEGQPIPVRTLTISGPTLSPHKLAVITTYTNEILERSTPDIETIVRAVLSESAALALDSYMFDAAAGDAVRPAGLRFGISPIAASAATSPNQAMREDVAALLGTVGQVGGNTPAVIVAGSRCAAALRLMPTGPSSGYEVFSSGVLADGDVIAIAPNAVASALDPRPEFTVTTPRRFCTKTPRRRRSVRSACRPS